MTVSLRSGCITCVELQGGDIDLSLELVVLLMNAHAIYLDQMSVLSVPKLIKLPSLVDQFAYYLVPIEVRLFRSLLRRIHEHRNVGVFLLHRLRHFCGFYNLLVIERMLQTQGFE